MRYLKLVQPTLHRVRQALVIDVETNVGPRRNAGEYTWPFHYHAIRLASKLQSSGHFAGVVGDACVLLGAELPTRLPSRWTLQRWELKLDLVDMLYRRKALNKEVSLGVTARRSLSADSSPQAGFNFFCVRKGVASLMAYSESSRRKACQSLHWVCIIRSPSTSFIKQ